MINKVILLGNLGKDMELRYTQGGLAIGAFSLATTRKWTSKDGEKNEETEWHKLTWFGKGAEAVSEWMTKGRQVYVEGRLKTEEWKDRDGNKRWTTKVIVGELKLLGGGKDSKRASASRNAPPPADEHDQRRRDDDERDSGTHGSGELTEDDIPF